MLPGATQALPFVTAASYPLVKSRATTNSAPSTTHSINLPTGIIAGDLLLMLVGASGITGVSAGWTALDALSALYRIADGTETPPTITVGPSAVNLTAVVYRIANYSGVPQSASIVTGASATTHDPPALSPSWGLKNTLWFAQGTCPTNTVTSFASTPANYTDADFLAPPVPGASTNLLWVGRRSLAAATEDPSAFTTAAGIGCRVRTIGVAVT